MNIPGLDKPSQPLTAIYGGAYAQDVWRPRTNLSVTAGLRFDVPVFENTALQQRQRQRADVPRRERPAGAVRQRQDARRQHPVVAALRLQLRRRRRSARPRCAAARACSPASRSMSGSRTSSATPACCRAASTTRRNTTALPVLDQRRPLQADQRHRRAGGQLRAERHRQRLPVPAGVAQQHRRRSPPARRHHRHRGVHLQPRRQRHLLHQRQPAGGADARSPAPTPARAGPTTASTTPPATRSPARSS